EVPRAARLAAREGGTHPPEPAQGAGGEGGGAAAAEERHPHRLHAATPARARCSPTRSALAAIVRLGLTPPATGSALASTTERFSTPRNEHHPSSGDVRGSRPMRT